LRGPGLLPDGAGGPAVPAGFRLRSP
jgi:hypothetical protein